MIALIDGDIILYRCGWASEKESEPIACARANKTIEDILEYTKADNYQVWFSDSLDNNFRFKIDPNYKANRKDQPKPKHYNGLRLFLRNEWDATITEYQEADDILGIIQSRELEIPHGRGDYSTIICTIDKDLRQVPGLHYNFVTKEFLEQDYVSGFRAFATQLLVGDRVDNIDGIDGIGVKKAARALVGLNTEREIFEKVCSMYGNLERLLKNGKLLWIRRKPNEVWEFPTYENIIQDESRESSDSPHGHSDGDETSSRCLL